MHYFSPLPFSQFDPFAGFTPTLLALFIAFLLWSLVIKAFALWYAARGGQKWWFAVLVILNTAGLLEIIYLIWFRPEDKPAETPAVHKSPEAQ